MPKGVPAQTFSIFAAITGLIAFAIVVALVEQLVLEILTQNVSRGSQVYEKGHILVLAWAWTQRDREVIWKILSQARPSLSETQQADCKGEVSIAGAALSMIPSADQTDVYLVCLHDLQRIQCSASCPNVYCTSNGMRTL